MTSRSSRVRVLVADDHPMTRAGLADILRIRPEFEVVAEVEDGRTALERIRALAPQVAALDVRMPELDGIAVLNAVERDRIATRVVLVSAETASSIVFEGIACGARAFLSKATAPEKICDTIAAVARGETVLPPEFQAGLASEIRTRRERGERPVLSPREL